MLGMCLCSQPWWCDIAMWEHMGVRESLSFIIFGDLKSINLREQVKYMCRDTIWKDKISTIFNVNSLKWFQFWNTNLKKRKAFCTIYPVVLFTGKIRDVDIKRIAGDLPQWQIVAKSLGIGYQDIEDIENNYTAPADQRMSFLSKWIWKDGAAATYEKLSEVLERLGEQGAA